MTRPIPGNDTPIRDRDWALFLDVDGTLVEIARRPDAVHVSERMRQALLAAYARESGALALVSGRSIADLDRLFQPNRFPAVGVHGLERRDASGLVFLPPVEPSELDDLRICLRRLAEASPGVLLEDKGYALAIHYREAMHLENRLAGAVAQAASLVAPRFHVLPGKCVFEIKPAGYSKGAAIATFLDEPPFAGRLPVFVGDDETDEDAFAVVNAHGGRSVHVGYSGPTAARWRLNDVNAVIRWLTAPHQQHGKRIPVDEKPVVR